MYRIGPGLFTEKLKHTWMKRLGQPTRFVLTAGSKMTSSFSKGIRLEHGFLMQELSRFSFVLQTCRELGFVPASNDA